MTTATTKRTMLSVSVPHPVVSFVLLLGVTLGLESCKDLTGNPGLPAGTPNPSFYTDATGALGMRNAAVLQFEQALQQDIIDTGLLTDELEDPETGASAGTLIQNAGQVHDPLDERLLPTGVTVQSYGQLQGVRTFATQALGALVTYDTAATAIDSAKILRGGLYALQGYTEIMLADLFCSGVPLSTLVFQGDFTYAPSSTTTQVYQAALAQFDTALSLGSASDSVVNLARVGQGRAYLDLGQYAVAADDVTTVPDGFTYQVALNWGSVGQYNTLNASATIADMEGINGLPFISSGDPRSAVDTVAITDGSGNPLPVPLTFPAKYGAGLGGSGYAPFTIASGVEARLIQAEAALKTGDVTSWLMLLNQLRTTVSGLSQISDPVDPTARIDTMFTERAEWLFLTGHRQGDLRRLLRQYGKNPQYSAFSAQAQVYPTGAYLAPGTGLYGTDVVAPIPPTESANPDFHGCLDDLP